MFKSVRSAKNRVKCIAWLVLVVLAALAPLNGHAAPPDSDDAKHTGDITGQVAVCGEPAARLLISVPGRSFLARTSNDGSFRLSYLPPGSYKLVIEQNDVVIRTVEGVAVMKNRTTNLGLLDECLDRDQDGFDQSQDCDDENPNVNPLATEECDGIDNNCDGQVDEGCPQCDDADGDGYFAQSGCGTVVDCDDTQASVNPSAIEICGDGIDNNCDGAIDEGCLSCEPGAPCTTGSFGECAAGVYDSECMCVPLNLPEEEKCDGLDNDCNGLIDDGVTCCSSPFFECNGQCVDFASDRFNCGICGRRCPGEQICRAGTCIDLCLNVSCNDGNPCTIDSCDPATGFCRHTIQNGMLCDDGNACTTFDACMNGICVPGPTIPGCS